MGAVRLRRAAACRLAGCLLTVLAGVCHADGAKLPEGLADEDPAAANQARRQLEHAVLHATRPGAGEEARALAEALLARVHSLDAGPAPPLEPPEEIAPGLFGLFDALAEMAAPRLAHQQFVRRLEVLRRDLLRWYGLVAQPDQAAALRPFLAEPGLAPTAAMALARIPGSKATHVLAEALPNAAPSLAILIIEGLAKGAGADSTLLWAARSMSGQTRWAAMNALAALGQAPRHYLDEAEAGRLQDAPRYAGILLRAAQALAGRGETARAERLYLEVNEARARPHHLRGAIGSLVRLNSESAVRLALAHAGAPGMHSAALRALVCTDFPGVEQVLARAYASTGMATRAAILMALAQRGAPQLEPLLAAAALAEEAELRFLAARLDNAAPDPADTWETAFLGPQWLRTEALRTFMDAAHAAAIAGRADDAASRFFAMLEAPAPARIHREAVESLGGLGRLDDLEALMPYRREPDLAETVWVAQARICASHAADSREKLFEFLESAPLPAAAVASEALQGLGEDLPHAAHRRGFLTDWKLLGPVPLDAALLNALPAQTAAADPPPVVSMEGVELAWSETGATGVPAVVDLSAALGPYTGVAAYGFARAVAGQWILAELRVGSSDGCQVWLNGARVLDAPGPRPFQPDENAVSIALRPGVNRVLIRTLQQRGDWRYCVRIMNRRGEPLDLTALRAPDDGTSGVGIDADALRTTTEGLP